MKLVINMLLGTLLAGLAESLALGEKVGLNQEQILHIMSLLPVASKLNAVKGEGQFCSFVSLESKSIKNGANGNRSRGLSPGRRDS